MANQQPIAKVRLGVISASIWANDNEKGTYYNVTFSRSYKDGKEWKHTDSYRHDDLLLKSKVGDLAHTKIFELKAEANRPSEES